MRIIGHGIDIVETERIGAVLEAHGETFLERCFTAAERAYSDGAPRRRLEHYAVRFAAKEAVLKALGTGWSDGIGWRDIEVLRLPSGRPALLLSGRARAVADELGVHEWQLSLSHTASYAVASAIASGGNAPAAPPQSPTEGNLSAY